MTEAYSFLHAHVLRFAPIKESDWNALLGKTSCHEFNSREILVKEASRCRQIYFVAKGCLRLYYTKDNGMEQTSDFALEGWWLTDLNSFSTDKLSSFAIQAVESSRVISIQRADYEELNNHYPLLAQYMLASFLGFTPEYLSERPQRIYLLSAWQETEIFSLEEKLAIQITEAMTIPGAQGFSDDLYEQGLAQWGIEGMAELLMLIAVINIWNRIAVSTRLGDSILLQRTALAK